MGKRESSQTIAHAKYRATLAPRREPYWLKLGKGCYLGFRAGPATWIARWTDKASKHHYRSIGDVEYDDARREAESWFTQCKGGTVRAGTVEDVCKRYIADQRKEKGDDAGDRSEGMFSLTIFGDAERGIAAHSIAAVRLDALTTPEIKDWRDGLVTDKRSRRGANRIFRSFKAALNYGFREGMAPTDVAWRRVQPLKGDGAQDQPRTTYLAPEQRAALLAHCGTELADYLRGLLYTAARPGELMNATVKDFDSKIGTLRLRTKKGHERSRDVPLDAKGVEFFKEAARSKLPNAPLLSHGGEHWTRNDISIQLRAAVAATNADEQRACDVLPTDTVAYTMRHCAISEMLIAGIDVGTVAKISGTSIQMIQKYYFKFIKTDVTSKLATIKRF